MTDFKLDVRLQIGVFLVLLISVALYFASKQVPQESVQLFIQSYGPLAPVIYIILHQLTIVLAPLNGFPFLIAGFFLFGPQVAFYSFVSSIIGYSINFWIAKKWGRPVVKKLAGEDSLTKIDKFAKEYGLGTLFILRMFLIGLGDYVSYAYGLTPVRYSTYIAVSAAGMIPGYIIWYFVVLRTGNIDQFLGVSIFLASMGIVIFVGGHYLNKKYLKWKSKSSKS